MRALRIAEFANKNILTGVDTYWTDFENIVLPEIARYYTINNEQEGADILSFCSLQSPLYEVSDRDVIIFQILHNDIKDHHNKFKKNYKNHRFVTHYSKFWKWMREEEIKATFIPMSVDTEKLPYRDKRNGKTIFFTNIYIEKQDTFDKIKYAGVDCDTMSRGKLNGAGNYTHDEAIEIVSEYEYGIGVGRSAIEMLSMGLKVVVAGKEYGGPIRSSKDITEHWATNFNSTHHSSLGIIGSDFKDLIKIEKKERAIFDMRTYLQLYKIFFEVN